MDTQINNNMTETQAEDILENFELYNREQILAAVNVLKTNGTYPETLADFFKKFEKTYENDLDNDYDLTYEIIKQDDNYTWKDILPSEVNAKAIAAYKQLNLEEADVFKLDKVAALLRAANSINGKYDKQLKAIDNAFIDRINKELDKDSWTPTCVMDAIEHYVLRNKDTENKNNQLWDLASQLNSFYDHENNLDKDYSQLDENDKASGTVAYSNVADPEYIDKKCQELIGRIEIVDDDEQNLNDEDKKNVIDVLKEAAVVRSQKRCFTSENEKIDEEFSNMVAEAYVAGTMDKLPEDDDIVNANRWHDYLKMNDEATKNRIDKLLTGTDKIVLKLRDVINVVAVTHADAEKFAKRLSFKLKGAETAIGKEAAKLGSFAKELWGNRYQITKAVVDNLSDRQGQLITNTTLAAGTAFLVATPIGSAAVIGYAVYTVAGNYIWPIVAEAHKMKRLAEEKGQTPAPWKARLKQAKENMKKSKSYQTRCKWGWVAGIAAAGLGVASMGLVNGAAASQISARAAKILGGAARAASTSLASITTNIYTKKDYKEGKVDKASLNAARVSTGLSLFGAGLASYLGINKLLDGNGLSEAQDVARVAIAPTPQEPSFTLGDYDSTQYVASADSVLHGAESTGVDTTALETPVVDDVEGNTDPDAAYEPVVRSGLSKAEGQMYDTLEQKWGLVVLQSKLALISDGKFHLPDGRVFDLPEGMKPLQAASAFQHLNEWTGVNNENSRILAALFTDCDEKLRLYSDAQIVKAINSLNAVEFEFGTKDVMVNGCPTKVFTFGQINVDKYNEITGRGAVAGYKAVYTSAQTFIDCPEGRVELTTHPLNIDCGCEKTDVPPVEEQVRAKALVVEEVVEVQPTNIPVNFAEHPEEIKISSDHVERVPVTATYSGNGAKYPIQIDSFNPEQAELKSEYTENGIDMVRVQYTGDVRGINGYEGSGSRQFFEVHMTKEAYENYMHKTPVEYETAKAPVTVEQYAQLLKPETNITWDKDSSGNGYDRFGTPLAGMKHITIPSAADLDANACNISITREGDFRVLNMQDENGQPIRIGFNEKGEGWIKNGKNEYVVMNRADREAMSETLTNYVKDHSEALFGKKVDAQFDFSLAKNTLTGRLDDIRNQDVKTDTVEYRREVEQKNVSFAKMLNNAKNANLVSIARNRGGNTI